MIGKGVNKTNGNRNDHEKFRQNTASELNAHFFYMWSFHLAMCGPTKGSTTWYMPHTCCMQQYVYAAVVVLPMMIVYKRALAPDQVASVQGVPEIMVTFWNVC